MISVQGIRPNSATPLTLSVSRSHGGSGSSTTSPGWCTCPTHSDALAVNDTEFIHVDFNDGKRVVVWLRGQSGSGNCVVVVANFSDFTSANLGAGGEYRVSNWPATPTGKRWHEVTQERDVPADWVGREAIAAWEAKVYCLVDA
jgi:pullulanase